ncbi:MAG: hypothetical protein KAT43_02485 [Nanoarchaeota archaeon]|nr:hypothetical protein [Nanoarchaeota archaeon]
MGRKVTMEQRLERFIYEENLRNSRITRVITSAEAAKKFMQQKGYQDRYNDPATLDELEAKDEEGMIEAAKRIRQKRPVAVVRLTRLDCIDPRTNEYEETSVRKVRLYDLDWLNTNHIILIGRDSRCDLRPFLKPVKEYEDIHKDKVPTDMEISKLHGIIYWKRGKLFYKDRSANGSTDNDDKIIHNSKIEWHDPLQYIGFGQFIPIKRARNNSYTDPRTQRRVVKRDLVECRQSRFKLWWSTYEMDEMSKALD